MKNHTSLVRIGGLSRWNRGKTGETSCRYSRQSSGFRRGKMGGIERGRPAETFDCFSTHTKESARALMETIKMAFPGAGLTLVVPMASNKDHHGFARECLSGKVSGHVEGVVLTEASIAGSKSRTTAASLLRNCWIQASKELGIDVLHDEMSKHQDLSVD
ncbi:unnamed protein product [Prunus brigantina]